MSQGQLLAHGAVDRDLPVETPERILERAISESADGGRIVRRVCLLSGGKDSTTTAHRMHDHYDELAFIDTGTAIEGVRSFVEEFAARLGKPLTVYDSGGAYAELVLGDGLWWSFFTRERRGQETLADFVIRTTPLRLRGDGLGNAPQGFPGPGRGGHRAAYTRLKERRVEELVRVLKQRHGTGRRDDRIVLLSGARRHESRRRSMTQGVEGYRRNGAQMWVNPLNEWTDDEMRAYRRAHAIPESDVSAILCRSGECNCGAYMSVGEVQEVREVFPSWHRRVIAPLEDAARESGIPRCVWGERTDSRRAGARGYDFGGAYDSQLLLLDPSIAISQAAPVCSDCEGRALATGVLV